MLVFSDIWTKTIFSKRSQYNVLFCRNAYIYVHMNKKDFFTLIPRKRNFSRNFDIFNKPFFYSEENLLLLEMLIFFTFGQKTIFSKSSKKSHFSRNGDILRDMGINDFFKMISRKRIFPRNVNIFGDMVKNDFFKVISRKRNFLLDMLIYSKI